MNKKLKILFIALLGFSTACDPDSRGMDMYGTPPPEEAKVDLPEDASIEDVNHIDIFTDETIS